jgi:geranylgeranyl diphosphate synthase type II
LQDIKSLQQKIELRLQEFFREIDKAPTELYQPMSYTLKLGGKRIRPLLVLLGCDLFDGPEEDALWPAIGIEIFHNFTLLHDDIMDLAPLRRNQPTVHKKWNSNIAILSGDAMFVKSCQLMARTRQDAVTAVLDLFWKTALEVCEGQQFDMNFETEALVPLAKYIRMISLKTAVLLGCSLQTGAIIAGAREEDARRIYEFGKYCGIAFQLQDDILDVYGNQEKFGKRKGGDIVSNKKTFLLLKALEIADRYSKESLLHWLQAGEEKAEEKVEAVTGIFDYLNIRSLAEKQMEKYFAKAIEILKEIPCAETKKSHLGQFTHALLYRDS